MHNGSTKTYPQDTISVTVAAASTSTCLCSSPQMLVVTVAAASTFTLDLLHEITVHWVVELSDFQP